MTAYTFAVISRERRQLFAQAAICPEARYASVFWLHPPRIDRRIVTGPQWTAILHEVGWNLPAGPLDEKSAIVQTIVGERAAFVLVQYLSAEPIDEAPEKVAVVLDERLKMLQQVV